MILYSIQWQASYHGNWSCHADKPASIWIIHIVTWPVAVASFTTDSIIIIHTKARSNYLHWRYSCKTAHAKKVELQYIADLRPCARYLIFKSLENKFFAELCTVTYFNKSKSSRLISHPSKAGSYKQTLILQIAHAAFDPLVVRQHFPCDSNFW